MRADKNLLIPAGVLADSDLRPAAKLVLSRLIGLAPAGGLVFIAQFILAGQVGLTERATKFALATLQRRGYVLREVSEGGRGRPRGYRILGAALRLADLRAVPPGEQTGTRALKLNQPTLFDMSEPGKEAHPGTASLQRLF